MTLSDTIIFMHGGPATGKTSIGERLAEELGIPYFSKDGVKEPIFDHVGLPTAWETDGPLAGKKMDDAAKTILCYLIEAQLSAHQACVIDSTFQSTELPTLLAIFERHPCVPIQVHCRADADLIEDRYRRRAATGERHPGHLDQFLADSFDKAELERVYQPLAIGGHVLDADTTDFSDADFEKLLESVKRLSRGVPRDDVTDI
jgi:predicted kinase